MWFGNSEHGNKGVGIDLCILTFSIYYSLVLKPQTHLSSGMLLAHGTVDYVVRPGMLLEAYDHYIATTQ